ncbi:MAG: phosphatase PAP2 family protein [Nocardioidaceae bacterium]
MPDNDDHAPAHPPSAARAEDDRADDDGRDRTDHIGSRDLTSWPSSAGQAMVRTVMRTSSGLGRWLDARSIPYVVLLVTAVIGVVVAGAFTVVSSQIYDNVGERDGIAGLDRPVLDRVIRWRTPTANRLITDYTDLGGPVIMPVIAVVAAAAIAWWWRRWTPVLLMALAAGGSLLLTVLGKHAIDRARPPQHLAVPPYETSASFPSGHTLNSWVILLMVAYLVCCRVDSLRWRVATVMAAVVLAVAMGLSRVYLGHHWLTDVLVAWTIGSAWLIVVITGHRLALTVVRRRP